MTAATATRVRPWRGLLGAHGSGRVEQTGPVVEQVLHAGLPDGETAMVLAAALRVSSPYVFAWLGVPETVAVLRRLGYFELPGVRERSVRLDDVVFVAAPGGTWPVQPVTFRDAPSVGVVFRGATDRGPADGLSWTPSLQVARRFAERRGGRVWACEPSETALLAGFADWIGPGQVRADSVHRVGDEYLLDPADLDIEEVAP